MATIAQFKLSKQGGLTRRLTFPTHPSWAVLSSKINETFGIATDNIGVSYLDQDLDEVTFSSEEELQDYYSTLGDAKFKLIRLSVQDLSSLRSTDVAPSRHHTAPPQQSHFRNTFGEQESLPFIWEVDDEWQRLPGSLGSLFLSSDSPESPHAFVEVLESDVSVSKKSNHTDEEYAIGDTTRSNGTFTMPTSRAEKGKSRVAMQPTVEDDALSTDSIFGDDALLQPQTRVYDSDQASTFGGDVKSPVSVDGTATPAQAQSTPVISGQVLPEAVLKSTEDSNTAIDDPALPTLGGTGASTLTHDVAAFLKAVSGIISSHPELSEGLRNIVSNATNGTYWTAHRDALSRAAERIQQETGRTVEEIQNAEEEASARVADALGGIFRVVGEAVQTARTTTEPFRPPPAEDVPTAPESVPEPQCFRPREFTTYPGPPPPGHFHPHPHHHWGAPPPPPPGRRHVWPRPPPSARGSFDESREEDSSHAHTSVSQGPPAATPVHEQTSVPPSTAVPAPSRPVTPVTPQVHIVSNARGLYPQLEMFSVPRRSHTIGHTARRGLEDRSRQRIMKKLSEMGFTEGTYPKLNAKVSEQMVAHPPTTKDIEDDIVTNLIEELIPSSFAPRASSSREPIPGAWA
ncbi:uncharacterized protein F5147DRAFT_566766 [Suillus discolor]|uniref:PB1 domain-containing protein n=1 Tax=Suillus discolor TaxID=1912936 RepID=A0A9P7FJC1_9AGAM|nr:uncharacterized protein F5147DRAFT_566766 [Suillus discolor]KAG2118017.1 hypothetical protein F5147DRAFT_566766 [Suillus discolor]